MSSKFKISMYITSFLPIWIMIIINNLWEIMLLKHNENITWSDLFNIKTLYKYAYITEVLSLILVFVICAFSISYIEYIIRDKENNYLSHREVIKFDEKLVATDYIVTTTLSFLAFDFTQLKGLILFLVYFSTLGYMCIKKNNYYVNLYLLTRGYRIYTCKITPTTVKGKIKEVEKETKEEVLSVTIVTKEELSVGLYNLYGLDSSTFLGLKNIEEKING